MKVVSLGKHSRAERMSFSHIRVWFTSSLYSNELNPRVSHHQVQKLQTPTDELDPTASAGC